MDETALAERAESIRRQYLDGLPPDYLGRHSAIADTDTVQMLFRAVSAGLNQRDSCQAAGIAPDTFQTWMARAERNPDGPFAALSADLKACRAAGKLAHLENIRKHSQKEWTASAWTLERTDPEQFGKRESDSSQPRVIVNIGVHNGEVQMHTEIPQLIPKE